VLINVIDQGSTVKLYLNIYKNVIEKIINDIGDNYVYLIVDETSDPKGL